MDLLRALRVNAPLSVRFPFQKMRGRSDSPNFEGSEPQIEGSTASVWDAYAAQYESERKGDYVYIACVDAAVDCCSPINGRIGLDAGCGTGMSSLRLAQRFDAVVAVDFSQQSLQLLRRKLDGRHIMTVRADIRSLPFRDGSFDGVLCANTLQHLHPGDDQVSAVKGLLRVAKPNAPVVLSVHHYSRDKRRRGWIKEGKPGQAGVDYIFRFTRRELLTLLPRAQVKGVGFYGLARLPLLGARLQRVVGRRLGHFAASAGYGHMLVARIAKD